jgi:hypothetical protein
MFYAHVRYGGDRRSRDILLLACSEMPCNIAVVAKAVELRLENVASHSFCVFVTEMRLEKQISYNCCIS